MERQPFLLNAVLLRQNCHDVVAWQKRAALYDQNDDAEMVVKTYQEALQVKRSAQKKKNEIILNRF